MSEMPPLLLDTHAAIWLFEAMPLARAASDAIDAAYQSNAALLVSPITAWEIGLLVSLRRIDLAATPQRWFRGLLDTPGVEMSELSPEILIAASFLPGKPPRDPADRILLATARELAATLVTRDRLLLAYAEEGNVSAVEC
jgi:PIN domain nuclease of toxin-antitoxin system